MLIGKNVFLRKLEKGDLERTWVWLHMQDVYDKIGVSVPFSHSQQEAWFEKTDKATDKFVFAVCRCNDSLHLGNVSIDSIDSKHRNARLSIFLADSESRGKGYGSEALNLLIEYAFDFLNLHKVWVKMDTDDPRVVRFYEKCGFIQEGVLKQHEFKNGKYIDKILFAKIRES